MLDFAKSHSNETVVKATTLAFARGVEENLEEDIAQCIAPLTAMKGIGPATASALLAAFDERYPFFSDEAAAIVLPRDGSDAYSLKRYVKFASLVRTRATKLKTLTPSQIERALWAESRSSYPPKRKAAEEQVGNEGKKKSKR